MTLWTYFRLKRRICSPQRRTFTIHSLFQRASFYICQKGSYTLEAAVVIPLVAMYLVTILSFFSMLEVQCMVEEALIYAGRKTAVESSVIDSEEAMYVSTKAYLLYALQGNSAVEKHVKHGVWGIHLWNSEFEGDELVLRAEYAVELPFSFFGIDEMELNSEYIFQKWTGDDSEEIEESFVYVTQYGEVYHVDLSCRSIRLSVKESTKGEIALLRGKDGQRYYECSGCDWADKNRERIYYTDYGTLYHKNINCSSIKRIIEKIKIEEVGNRRPCSFCYKL